MIYAMLGIMIILFIIMIIVLSKKIKQEKLYKEEYIQKQKQKYESELRKEREAVQLMHQECKLLEQNYAKEQQKQNEALESRKEMLNAAIAQMEENKKNLERAQSELQEQSKDKLDIVLSNYYQNNLEEYERTLRATQKSIQSDIEQETTELYNKCFDELAELRKDIEEYRAKRAVINEQILKQRAIEEKQDFYRVCITDQDLEDIAYLTSILNNIHHKETLNKLIWSEYLQQPFKKMLNNILGNSDPKNVIYKITNIDTKEIYIGKTSGSVSNRWTEHIKTSLNIGTIKSAPIHKALYNNWSRFTFEVLEKVPQDDNLGEHEKYWINFYQSTVYGYNVKSGG